MIGSSSLRISPSSSESRPRPSLNGMPTASCRQSGPTEGTVGTSTRTQCINNLQERRRNTFTPESRLTSNSRTFKDKLLCCRKRIPTMTLSKTLDQASISREEDSSPFWTTSLEDTYRTLWLPTETDLLDLDSTCCNTSLTATKCPLQCCQMMTSRSLQQSWQDQVI